MNKEPFNIARCLKRIFESFTPYKIYKTLPRGTDFHWDLEKHLEQTEIVRVFDVGANIGQSARKFSSMFPMAEINSFEPVKSTYTQLLSNTKHLPQVKCFNLAFGAERGVGEMVLGEESANNALRNPHSISPANSKAVEKVQIETLDEFCEAQQVERISYLKIDTEGADLNVLRGAPKLLEKGLINIIQVEAGMNRRNTTHVHAQEFMTFLEERSYFLFGVYDQVREWPTKEPHLRRANLVFISRQIINDNSATLPR